MEHHVTLFALKVSRSLYYVTSVPHGVVNCFPGLQGKGISDAIFFSCSCFNILFCSSNLEENLSSSLNKFLLTDCHWIILYCKTGLELLRKVKTGFQFPLNRQLAGESITDHNVTAGISFL